MDEHFPWCPEWETPRPTEAYNEPNDCPDCALIAVAYSNGYSDGWIDAGQEYTDKVREAVGATTEDMYETLRQDSLPSNDYVEVFR